MVDNNIYKRINKYFEEDKQTSIQIFDQLNLSIFAMESGDTDLFMLAKLLKEEDLIKLINYYDGDTMVIPSIKEYRRCKLLAFTFYLKEILNKSWAEIKDYLNIPENYSDFLSPISLGRRISQIKEELHKDILNLLKDVTIDDVKLILYKENKNG